MKWLWQCSENRQVITPPIKNKHIYSFFTNEQECIKSILNIHNDGNRIDVDPMYNKGMFYKNNIVEKPLLRFDINASKNGYDAKDGDAKNLPINDNSQNCIILDPPFLFGNHGQVKNNIIGKRYTIFDTFDNLKDCYIGILKEAHRILRNNGICIFKCQDYTDSMTYMIHCLVYKWAVSIGFYAKDIAILNIDRDKIYNGYLKQRHLRKTHCYFWVFQKNSRCSTVAKALF